MAVFISKLLETMRTHEARPHFLLIKSLLDYGLHVIPCINLGATGISCDEMDFQLTYRNFKCFGRAELEHVKIATSPVCTPRSFASEDL